ncbi:helix-turn-helix domain-containing protein [Halomonas mongoliensis]|uniref:helix-turn-helix domain-containing protein n=1 Tax=Halomonas mongoliensis TaxID=321265 RepID=UPI00403AEA2E
MQRLQAFKYELIPNGEQVRKMRQFAGMARFVFNRGLALQKERYAAGEKKLGYAALCKELTGWRGAHLIVVPPHHTSRTCPECGHVAAENRPSQARFACVECGYKANADHVAAINVLRAGHARLACEVSGAVRPPAAGTHRSDSGAAQRCA